MNDDKILLVDDDRDTCSNLSDILSDLGYTVDVAYRGEEALQLLKKYSYRLALLDYFLPDINGVGLFRRMRQINGSIDGLLVTAFASNDTAKEAVAAGLRHVVHKPVEIPQLMPLIEAALGVEPPKTMTNRN